MAGKGPAPKAQGDRRNRTPPARGDWVEAGATGWQHGPIPAAPPKVVKATRDVWGLWFRSWFAAHWQPEDLAGLYIVGKLYDAVMRGELQRAAELRQNMDAYGMTPKGQQDRRWRRPSVEVEKGEPARGGAAQGRYGHLRPVASSPAKATPKAKPKRAARPRKAAGS